MEGAKITSVEKVKDPKKVEAGKKLAAMSKQAKERKAAERLTQKISDEEFQIPSINPLAVVGVVGVVGVAVYYRYFYKSEKLEGMKLEDEVVESEDKPEYKSPKRKELDTLD